MEFIGSSFFLLMLLTGVALIILNRKATGMLFCCFSMTMLYLVPGCTFNDFKEASTGTYSSNLGRTLYMERDCSYRLLDRDLNTVERGQFSFRNVDGGLIEFEGETSLSGRGGKILDDRNPGELFRKERTNRR